MVDFLKANPYVSREEYLWEWTLPQVQLASIDFTHVVYLSEKQAQIAKREKIFEDPMEFMNDLGMPVFQQPEQKK